MSPVFGQAWRRMTAQALKQRLSATEQMIRDIDSKISRLGTARTERVAALSRIRDELARSQQARQAAPDHERSS